MPKLYSYPYPRPAVTVDIVCGRQKATTLEIVLIKRKNQPFKGEWALPGGFVEIDEDLETAAKRELYEETQLTPFFLRQFYTFGAVNRDPRGRTIAVGYEAMASPTAVGLAGSDADSLAWYSITEIPTLAFDHDEIVNKALQWIANCQEL